MNKLVLGMAVAATLLAAAPAMAQVTFRGGDDGFGVRVGPGWDRGHHYGWRNHRAERVVVVKRHHREGVVFREGRRHRGETVGVDVR